MPYRIARSADFHLRLEPELFDCAWAAANAEQRTMSDWARNLIARELRWKPNATNRIRGESR